MLEQRHDICKRFVKGQRIAMTILDETTVHSVQQGMRRFVGNDVVREARKNDAVGNVVSGRARRCREIPEQQGFFRRAVIGVGLPESMWVEPQSREKLLLFSIA